MKLYTCFLGGVKCHPKKMVEDSHFDHFYQTERCFRFETVLQDDCLGSVVTKDGSVVTDQDNGTVCQPTHMHV